ncbi:hypothetical protein PRIPAC_94251 [Pristionchus pacificus]|uniref:Uncharacterized protein n=1 Tax=Pristionchus pacificus TaxID=54126 RepID=A0A2A6BIJ9_PRIPA|nr:hypothetical protein PRIPAC_94251 [Pristionchus pacificus]|eukprot:PDM65658.1 hypothetical protein PRIPAC_45572 [Pristionchus pacificus]
MTLPLLCLLIVYISTISAAFPRITLGDIPLYKFPCTGNLTDLTERQQARCKSRNNNVYCKVFRLCLNFSFGNLYLTAYGFWRGNGFYPQKNYHIHALGGAGGVAEAVEVQRPRVDALKNAISVIRRKNSGDNLALGLKKEEDAEKIVKEGHLGENVNEKKEIND